MRNRTEQANSTVTLFAKFRGLSTSVPRAQAVWWASNWSGTTCSMGLSGRHRPLPPDDPCIRRDQGGSGRLAGAGEARLGAA